MEKFRIMPTETADKNSLFKSGKILVQNCVDHGEILPLLCAGMLALGYGYHVLLRGEDLAVDIAIYVLLMAAGFWLPTRFSGPFQGIRWILPAILTALLGVLLALFTLWPPKNILFTELSAVRTWLTIPI